MKRIFVIDWILIVVFIVATISGFGLHIVGHWGSCEVLHNWATFHVWSSGLLLVAIIFHVSMHMGWYRGIIENGIGRKSRVTVVLSIVFLLLSVTGGSLLVINESDSSLGLWHYKIGIITTVITVGHVIKRLHALRRSLNTKKQ